MSKILFIDGADKSGKSTLIKNIATKLASNKVKVRVLNKYDHKGTTQLEYLAQHYGMLLKAVKLIKDGVEVVLIDRSYLTVITEGLGKIDYLESFEGLIDLVKSISIEVLFYVIDSEQREEDDRLNKQERELRRYKFKKLADNTGEIKYIKNNSTIEDLTDKVLNSSQLNEESIILGYSYRKLVEVVGERTAKQIIEFRKGVK